MFDGWEAQAPVVGRIAFAMLLGGAIGLEREMKDRPAGFRTHMLVAGAAAMLTGMGDMMLALAQHEGDERVQIDPFRLVEAVIAGVAFIGAGTMIAHRGRVVAGITTAASLLMVAVIGVAVGFGHGWLALLATLLTFAVLSVLAWLEGRVAKRTDDQRCASFVKLFHRAKISRDGARAGADELFEFVVHLLQALSGAREDVGKLLKLGLDRAQHGPDFRRALFDGQRAEAHLQTVE